MLDLKPGEAEVIKRRVLIDQLGPQKAAEFGFVETTEAKTTGKHKSAKDGHRPLKARPHAAQNTPKPDSDPEGEDD